MAYRHQVTPQKTKEGKWKLAIFAPTRHGHTFSGYIEGGLWATKKEATEAKVRVRWWEFTTTDGRKSDRRYWLLSEKELRKIQKRNEARAARL